MLANRSLTRIVLGVSAICFLVITSCYPKMYREPRNPSLAIVATQLELHEDTQVLILPCYRGKKEFFLGRPIFLLPSRLIQLPDEIKRYREFKIKYMDQQWGQYKRLELLYLVSRDGWLAQVSAEGRVTHTATMGQRWREHLMHAVAKEERVQLARDGEEQTFFGGRKNTTEWRHGLDCANIRNNRNPYAAGDDVFFKDVESFCRKQHVRIRLSSEERLAVVGFLERVKTSPGRTDVWVVNATIEGVQ